MIKINLSSSQPKMDLTDVGGIDFTRLKFKAVILAVALMYLPDFTLMPWMEEQLTAANNVISEKRAELTKLQGEGSKLKEMEKQIQILQAQEASLEKKLTAVKEAISEKKNPSAILLYIAKNIPKELWISDLAIEGSNLTIRGEAADYTSIGNFVNALRSSIFIKEANISNTSSKVRDSDKKRIESFEVKFVIARFNQ